MSKSFMYDLYFGHLVPWECGRSQDPSYTPITRKISALKVYLKEQLSPDAYSRFEEMENLQAQSGTIEEINLFEYGFCMATLMMIDVLSFKDSRLTQRESE